MRFPIVAFLFAALGVCTARAFADTYNTNLTLVSFYTGDVYTVNGSFTVADTPSFSYDDLGYHFDLYNVAGANFTSTLPYTLYQPYLGELAFATPVDPAAGPDNIATVVFYGSSPDFSSGYSLQLALETPTDVPVGPLSAYVYYIGGYSYTELEISNGPFEQSVADFDLVSGSLSLQSTTATPEPGSLLLAGTGTAGLLMLLGCRERRRRSGAACEVDIVPL
jgi:hypothetical protein